MCLSIHTCVYTHVCLVNVSYSFIERHESFNVLTGRRLSSSIMCGCAILIIAHHLVVVT